MEKELGCKKKTSKDRQEKTIKRSIGKFLRRNLKLAFNKWKNVNQTINERKNGAIKLIN